MGRGDFSTTRRKSEPHAKCTTELECDLKCANQWIWVLRKWYLNKAHTSLLGEERAGWKCWIAFEANLIFSVFWFRRACYWVLAKRTERKGMPLLLDAARWTVVWVSDYMTWFPPASVRLWIINSFKKSFRMLLHRLDLELAVISFFLFIFNHGASELVLHLTLWSQVLNL